MSRFQRYSEFKSTDIDWIPHIPGHWKCLALSRITQSRCDGPFGSGLKSRHYTMDGVRVIRLQNIGAACFIDSDAAYIDPSYYEQELGDHSVISDDVIIAGLGDKNNPAGRACVAPHAISPAMVKADCFRFRLARGQANPSYVAYQLTSTSSSAAVCATGATRSRMNLSSTASRRILLPPISEQRRIVTFLDRETSKLDALIQKKQRLIELLNEKRVALISHAVTKGLDPSVAMRPSGVEWIGEIPVDWQVKPLWAVVNFLDHMRIPLSSEERSRLADTYPYYGASGIIDYVADYIFAEPLILVAEDGANLFSRSTPLSFVATGKYWVNNHAHILRPRNMDLAFLARALESVVYDPWITGSAQPKLTRSNLGEVRVPVPPHPQQLQIVEGVNHKVSELESLISRIGDAISCLQEYRAALISAAVTGQIDVRDEV